jgi:hypothetical protein
MHRFTLPLFLFSPNTPALSFLSFLVNGFEEFNFNMTFFLASKLIFYHNIFLLIDSHVKPSHPRLETILSQGFFECTDLMYFY